MRTRIGVAFTILAAVTAMAFLWTAAGRRHPVNSQPSPTTSRTETASEVSSKPEVAWRFQVRGGAFDTTPTIDEDRVFVGDLDGNLYALDLQTGNQIWRHEAASPLAGKPMVRRGSVVVGDVEGRILCLDVANGQLQWDVRANAPIATAATFHRNRVLVPTIDAKLLCLHIGSGDQVWEFEADDQIHAPVTVVDDFGILVAACSSKLQVLDLMTGNAVRSLDLPGETVGELAVRDSVAFAATMRGYATSLDWSQSETNWTVAIDENLPQSEGGVVLQDETLVVTSNDRRIRAFRAGDGDLLWSFPLRGTVSSKPKFDNENVLFGTSRGRVYALDHKTGKEQWHREFGGDFTGSPAVAGSRLVVANGNGNVYCLLKP